MLQEFRPPEGASILDMVLNTYTSLNLLPKFLKDNRIVDLNSKAVFGDVFVFDTDFIDNAFLYEEILKNGYLFRTNDLPLVNINDNRRNFLLAENGLVLRTETKKNLII